MFLSVLFFAFSALTLLVRQQEGIWPVKNEWWGAGVVICLGRDLRNAHGPADTTATHCLLLQEIQIGFGFIFLVPAHPGSPEQNPESCLMVTVVVVVVVFYGFNCIYIYARNTTTTTTILQPFVRDNPG